MKKGKKVWYLNHWQHTINKGILISTENISGFDEEPTVYVKAKYGKERILSIWVFSTIEEAEICLKKFLHKKIGKKEEEVKHLKSLLKE